jgi:5-(carboxyamino)imidazole ribonucleotide mutase
MNEQKKVAVVMGSDSDFPTVSAAVKKLKSFGIPVETRVISAHRTPREAAEFASSAEKNGFGVIIAAAGMAAHLAGVLAAYTTLPVIGIPMKSAAFGGLDALLATVQMPSGIPVATVAVNGAENAAVLAVEILALSDAALAAKLKDMKKQMEEKVAAKNSAVQAEAEKL